MCLHEYAVALCGITANNAALSLSLVGHTCSSMMLVLALINKCTIKLRFPTIVAMIRCYLLLAFVMKSN